MKQESKRLKGRKLQNLVKDLILETFPNNLKPEDVKTPRTGQNGADIILSPIAQRLIPYQFETKNQEKFKTIYDMFKQAKKHGKKEPVLVIKMNGREALAIIDLVHFFELIRD